MRAPLVDGCWEGGKRARAIWAGGQFGGPQRARDHPNRSGVGGCFGRPLGLKRLVSRWPWWPSSLQHGGEAKRGDAQGAVRQLGSNETFQGPHQAQKEETNAGTATSPSKKASLSGHKHRNTLNHAVKEQRMLEMPVPCLKLSDVAH